MSLHLPYSTYIRSFLFLLSIQLLAIFIPHSAWSQTKTSVQGRIEDAKTGERIPYVGMQFEGTQIGGVSDLEGNFYLETDKPVRRLVIQMVGYTKVVLNVKPGQLNTYKVKLEDETKQLDEVTISSGKYKRKNNPALDFMRLAIDNKQKNRKQNFDYYQYQKYEKTTFALNNVSDKTKNSFIFKNIKFIFDNVDTNKANGKVSLPLFIRESTSDMYFRKSPRDQKERIQGERVTNIGNLMNIAGTSEMLTHMYQDVDIYDDNISLLLSEFISPMSSLAPTFYNFYLQDTTLIQEDSCVHLYFAPRVKEDKAFIGHIWIQLDSTYAVRKIDLGIPRKINMNWLNEMQLTQEFAWFTDSSAMLSGGGSHPRSLMLSRDDIFMDFGLFRGDSTRSILGVKSTNYAKYKLNQPVAASIFSNSQLVYRSDSINQRDEQYWEAHRLIPLEKHELGIYKTVDTLNRNRWFMNRIAALRFLIEGYTPIGGFSIGPVNTFYSFNEVEGFRPRLGGRTNEKFSTKIGFETFIQYGVKDEKWKGYFASYYNFGSSRIRKFPLNQIKVWYHKESQFPGLDLQFVNEDNFLLSFKRGVTDKMLYRQSIGGEYTREFNSGWRYDINAAYVTMEPAGTMVFAQKKDTVFDYHSKLKTTEAGLHVRYAPNEKFYEGATYRTPVLTKYPKIDLWYTAGLDGNSLGDYHYHKVQVQVLQNVFIPPLGYSRLVIGGGIQSGTVDFPLLFIPPANQTYAYQLYSYNLMNFMEFVSDRYVSATIDHNFGGFFFNRIPLLRKLKWRETLSGKLIHGSLRDDNNPSINPDTRLQFPKDDQGTPLTTAFQKEPYIEVSAGIANILKVIRIDYVQRLTYLDHPNVSKWGIRTRVKFEF